MDSLKHSSCIRQTRAGQRAGFPIKSLCLCNGNSGGWACSSVGRMLAEHLEALGSCPAPYKVGVVMHTGDPSAQEVEEDQKLEAILYYIACSRAA